jgi:hypothetical protein
VRIIFACLPLLAGIASAGITFIPFGSRPGYVPVVQSLSHDGRVAAGYSNSAETGLYFGFSFSVGTGFSDTPYSFSTFSSLSADGRYVTGGGSVVTSNLAYRAAVADWSALSLGRPPGLTSNVYIGNAEISADGSVVAGHYRYISDPNRTVPWVWTQDRGIVNIGHLGASSGFTQVFGMSYDGRMVVGNSQAGSNAGGDRAFVWSPDVGMRALPMPGGGNNIHSVALAISGDGRIISGGADTASIYSGLLWRDGVPELLPTPSGTRVTALNALSFDGSIGLGTTVPLSGPNDQYRIIYTQEWGALRPEEYFARHGFTFPSTANFVVNCLSGDGRSFGGYYWDNTLGVRSQGFILTIPSPGTAALLCAGLTLTARRRRTQAGQPCHAT